MEYINWIQENWFELVEIAGLVVLVASAISAMTETPKDDAFVSKVKRFIDKLALLVGKAKKK